MKHGHSACTLPGWHYEFRNSLERPLAYLWGIYIGICYYPRLQSFGWRHKKNGSSGGDMPAQVLSSSCRRTNNSGASSIDSKWRLAMGPGRTSKLSVLRRPKRRATVCTVSETGDDEADTVWNWTTQKNARSAQWEIFARETRVQPRQ